MGLDVRITVCNDACAAPACDAGASVPMPRLPDVAPRIPMCALDGWDGGSRLRDEACRSYAASVAQNISEQLLIFVIAV